jgi:hypothetical protein
MNIDLHALSRTALTIVISALASTILVSTAVSAQPQALSHPTVAAAPTA